MATSSDMTTGDALVMAADVIRLLAPVLKTASKCQINNLKRNSKQVQKVFGRMLEGEDPVVDYSRVLLSTRIVNETGLEFAPHLRFKAEAAAMGGYPDSFNVTIVIPGVEVPLWTHKLSKHINWLGWSESCREGFVSLDSALRVKSFAQAWKLRNAVQSSLLTEALSIVFFENDGAHRDQVPYGVCAKLDGSDWWCASYFNGEDIKPLLKSSR